MSKIDPSQDRKARLAEALRANLKRRKGQARARSGATSEPPDAPAAATLAPQNPPKKTDGR